MKCAFLRLNCYRAAFFDSQRSIRKQSVVWVYRICALYVRLTDCAHLSVTRYLLLDTLRFVTRTANVLASTTYVATPPPLPKYSMCTGSSMKSSCRRVTPLRSLNSTSFIVWSGVTVPPTCHADSLSSGCTRFHGNQGMKPSFATLAGCQSPCRYVYHNTLRAHDVQCD